MTDAAVRNPVLQKPERKFHIIDTDVHERADLEALLPYLDPMWHKYITDFGWTPDRVLPFAQYAVGGLDRADSKLPDGRPAGSDYGSCASSSSTSTTWTTPSSPAGWTPRRSTGVGRSSRRR